MKYTLHGGTIVTPDYVIQGGAVTVKDNRILSVGKPEGDSDFDLQLEPKDLIFPGLINAHDHMLGTYYPRIGTGPYINWLPWDNDLKEHPLYQERSLISNQDLYFLSAYRQIVSGVTTVSDHMPHSVNKDLIHKMPVRVIPNYTLEHECSSYDLRWGRGISDEHREAKEKNWPFITHLEEGFDEEAMLGVDMLSELKVLDEQTVLIHGIAFSDKDIDLLAKNKVNVVWCPNSNYYMFKQTTNIKRLLEKGVNVSLGTDSPMSGGQNLLEELQFASTLYKQIYKEELDEKTLVKMVTVNAARAFKLKDLGRIEPGYIADLLIIKGGDPANPYKSLVKSWFNNIGLLIKDGVPIYGNVKDKPFFEKFKGHYQLLNVNGLDRIIIGKPLDLYRKIWENVKFKKVLPFFPVDSY